MTNPMLGSLKNPFVDGKIVGVNVSGETYRKSSGERGKPDYIMSRGELLEFGRCPARWIKGYQSDESKATEWGTLIDALALGNGEQDSFRVTPETYTNEKGEVKPWNWNAKVCKEWGAQWKEDVFLVKHETFTQAKNAEKFLFSDPQIKSIIQSSQHQVMVMATYQDAQTDVEVPIKCLLDMVPALDSDFNKCLADLKTCNSAAIYPWTKAVFDHGYHVQAAMYLDAYVSATGEDRTDFLHVLQESYPPWQTAKRILSAEFVELGRIKYIDCLKRYCDCLKHGRWPDYDESAISIFNGWALVSPEAYMAQ